jgi:hypothetical protein
MNLKGQYHEIFGFWFFHESVSPLPQSIPLGMFQIFSKIRRDIRKSRCTTLSMTPVENLPPVSMKPVANNGTNIRLLTP